VTFPRIIGLGLALCLPAAFAAPASAVVGGTDVPAGQRGYVAYISIDGIFACTGTLVTPTFVVTAGHCSTVTAGTPLNVPIGKAGQEITVTLGSVRRNDLMGERPGVKRVIVHPEYVFTNNGGNSADVALLELATPSVQTPVPLLPKGDEALFKPGTPAQIAGFGVTEEGGSTPAVLQEAEVPIVADTDTAEAYPDSFENRTQLGAGFPQGGVDSCQGDSGGPLLVTAPNGSLRLVGDTSYGEGCARPGKPGIYGRLGSDALRDFVAATAPGSVAPLSSGAATEQQAPQQPAASRTPSQPQPGANQPEGGSSNPKQPARKRKRCSRMHRSSARHNRSAKHKRDIRKCKRRRAQSR